MFWLLLHVHAIAWPLAYPRLSLLGARTCDTVVISAMQLFGEDDSTPDFSILSRSPEQAQHGCSDSVDTWPDAGYPPDDKSLLPSLPRSIVCFVSFQVFILMLEILSCGTGGACARGRGHVWNGHAPELVRVFVS